MTDFFLAFCTRRNMTDLKVVEGNAVEIWNLFKKNQLFKDYICDCPEQLYTYFKTQSMYL